MGRQHPSTRYRRIVRIGGGGMADVFLSVAEGPEGVRKLVVLKRIHRQLLHDPEIAAMFLDEARIAARFNHPNVVQTYEIGAEGGAPFLCMEHLDGQPFSRIRDTIRRADGLSLGVQLRVLADALAGLDYAHGLCDYSGAPLAVIHRDVSPQNIFVTYDGQVKVIDFGIAKALDSRHQTSAGVFKGKIAYMAPEQALGEFIDHRVDIFAAGTILWEMLTGRRMFQGNSYLTIVRRLVAGDFPSPRSIDPSIPERLEAICARAIARRREDRYGTAAELQRDLEEVIEPVSSATSLRDLGKLMAERFKEERQAQRARVREALVAQAEAPPAEARPAEARPAKAHPDPVRVPGDDERTIKEKTLLFRPEIALPPPPRGAQGGTHRRMSALSLALVSAALTFFVWRALWGFFYDATRSWTEPMSPTRTLAGAPARDEPRNP